MTDVAIYFCFLSDMWLLDVDSGRWHSDHSNIMHFVSYQTCGYWMWTQGGGIVTIATLCTLFPIRHVAIGCGLREVA